MQSAHRCCPTAVSKSNADVVSIRGPGEAPILELAIVTPERKVGLQVVSSFQMRQRQVSFTRVNISRMANRPRIVTANPTWLSVFSHPRCRAVNLYRDSVSSDIITISRGDYKTFGNSHNEGAFLHDPREKDAFILAPSPPPPPPEDVGFECGGPHAVFSSSSISA